MSAFIDKQLARMKDAFPASFVYKGNELIIEKKNNIYFRIDTVKSDLDFVCKVVEYLSRPAHKGLTPKWQTHIREGMNRFLGTNFNVEELSKIYTYLGNGCSRAKTEIFVRSGFDLRTIGE